MQNPLSLGSRQAHSRSRGETALQERQLPGKMLGRWQLQPDGIASPVLEGTVGQCLQRGSALAHPRLSQQCQPHSSLACQAHASRWQGLLLLHSGCPSSSTRKAWRSRARVQKRREGDLKPQLSTALQLRLQSQGWQCCSSYLHDLESPGQAAGRNRKASSSSCSVLARTGEVRQGTEGRVPLGMCHLSNRAHQMEQAVFTSVSAPKRQLTTPTPSLDIILWVLGLFPWEHMRRKRWDLMSLVWDPAQGSRRRSTLYLCSPEGRTASPALPGRRRCQHKGRPPRLQRVYLESSE